MRKGKEKPLGFNNFCYIMLYIIMQYWFHLVYKFFKCLKIDFEGDARIIVVFENLVYVSISTWTMDVALYMR